MRGGRGGSASGPWRRSDGGPRILALAIHSDQDPEVAAEVRRLTALLAHRSEELNSAGE